MTFLVCNMLTGKCTVLAPTPEGIEREFNRVDAFHKPRGWEEVITEIPDVLGVTLHNYQEFPRNMIFDGVTVYQQRKRAP